MTSKGEKERALYGLFFHQLQAHLVSDLKRVCPMHVMTEWMEMWWGPLRRLTLATSSRDTRHATLNMVRRLQMKELYQGRYGARQDYAQPAHSDRGPIGSAYLKSYGHLDAQRVELDERFLDPSLESLLRQLGEYVELGEGTWYSVVTRDEKTYLSWHVGADDQRHARPALQSFATHSAADGRAIEDAAFERYQLAPGNLVERFCRAARPTTWRDVRSVWGQRVEPDSDDEDAEDEHDEDELDAEAEHLGDGADAADVDVAPTMAARALRVLDVLDDTKLEWCNLRPADTAAVSGTAELWDGGRRIGTFAGGMRRGKPDGHGRLELATGDVWCGEMAGGMLGGRGEAQDEGGNHFVGNMLVPESLMTHAANAQRAARAAARTANAPFDVDGARRAASKLRVASLREALRELGEGELGTKPALVERLVAAQHEQWRRSSDDATAVAASIEGIAERVGFAGKLVRASGGMEEGLFEEGTLALLHACSVPMSLYTDVEAAVAAAESAATAAAATAAALGASASAASTSSSAPSSAPASVSPAAPQRGTPSTSPARAEQAADEASDARREEAAGWPRRSCAERRLLPRGCTAAGPGGVLEVLEEAAAADAAARLQHASQALRHARLRAMLAIVRSHLGLVAEGSGGGSPSAEAQALRDRQGWWFAQLGLGVPALAAELQRRATELGLSFDAGCDLLDREADLLEEVKFAAKLTCSAPRERVRKSVLPSEQGTRGETMLGGKRKAAQSVLGGELERAERLIKQKLADLEVLRARVEELKARQREADAFDTRRDGADDAGA